MRFDWTNLERSPRTLLLSSHLIVVIVTLPTPPILMRPALELKQTEVGNITKFKEHTVYNQTNTNATKTSPKSDVSNLDEIKVQPD